MALIKCPECGRKISNTVDECPHCGYVFEKKAEEAKPLKNITIAQRNHASAVLSGLCGVLGGVAIIFFIIWAINGMSQAAPAAQVICFIVLAVGALLLLLSIPLGSFAKRNNNAGNICMTYNPNTKKFILYCLDGSKKEVDSKNVVGIKNNISNKLIVMYKNDAGVTCKENLGICFEKYYVKTNIKYYQNKRS